MIIYLHVLFVLAPIFVYQFFCLDRFQVNNFNIRQYLMGLCSGISGILCMTFPIELTHGFILDMRWLLFIIAILYGGIRGLSVAALILLPYRLYLGGHSIFITILILALISISVFWIRKKYLTSNRYRKMLLGAGLSCYAYAVVLIVIGFYLNHRDWLDILDNWKFYSNAAIITIMTMVLSVYLTESVYENFVLRSQIQDAIKLTAISEMAASIAHEVRNPLTVVKGFMQLSKSSVSPKVNQYMDTALMELQRAEGIINDYLNFAKPRQENLETFDISVNLQTVVNIMSSFALMYAVEIKSDSDANLAVRGDKEKIKQAFVNIVKNGIESMTNGGELQIKARRQGKTVVIQVIDQGIGMSSEQLKRIGNPFFTTKEHGTGLGVMVTRKLIEAMGGTIRYQSEIGKGTTVQVTLPLTD